MSRNDLTRFGLNPHSPIAAYVKRLRCGECGSSSVMAKRTTQPLAERDRPLQHLVVVALEQHREVLERQAEQAIDDAAAGTILAADHESRAASVSIPESGRTRES